MNTVKVSKDIGTPVVYVFRTFTDIESSPAHVTAIKKVEMLTSGGVRIDTTFSFRPIHGGTKVTVEGGVADLLGQDLSDLKYVLEH